MPATVHSEFEDKIVTVARTFGWFAMGVRPAIRGRKGGWVTPWRFDGTGFPDLFLCHPERGALIFAEVKIPPDKPTAEQAVWLDRLVRTVCNVSVVADEIAWQDQDHGAIAWHDGPVPITVAVWTPDDWSSIVDLLSAGQATTTP